MSEYQLWKYLKKINAAHRFTLAIVVILLGIICIILAFTILQGVFQTSLAAIGSALIGAGLLALYDALTFAHQIREILRESNLKEALRDAFDKAENLREDGIKLGVTRILASIDDVRKQSSIEEFIDGASLVYILGTSVFVTSHLSTYLESKPNTQFRFIFVDLPPERGNQLEEALSIIHNVPIRGQIEPTRIALDNKKKTLSNVDYRRVQFVPPFSAILALGENENGEPWGRLQIDSYLIRTSPDSHLWLIIDGPGTLLFDRYQVLIEDIWHNQEKYDIRTAKISPYPGAPSMLS